VKTTLMTIASASLFLSAGFAIADSHEPDKPTFTPVEAYACNYRDGKGPADLEKVNAAWNNWMDDEEQGDYFAALLMPHYYGERQFDVAWLGVWRDGNAMGTGTDLWIDEGGEFGAAYNEVVDCFSHTNYASQRVQQAPDTGEESDGAFVVSFSNCSVKEGRTFDEYLAAQTDWNAYAEEHGIHESAWVWWPIYGESDDDYHFKIAVGMPDHTTAGANWQLYSEGHYQKWSELFDHLIDCDSARLYDGRVVREMAEE